MVVNADHSIVWQLKTSRNRRRYSPRSARHTKLTESIRFSRIEEPTTRLIVFRRSEASMSNTVELYPSIGFPDAEKLNVLRQLDQFRQWHSLDDKRYCLICGKIITGQQSTWGTVLEVTVR